MSLAHRPDVERRAGARGGGRPGLSVCHGVAWSQGAVLALWGLAPRRGLWRSPRHPLVAGLTPAPAKSAQSESPHIHSSAHPRDLRCGLRRACVRASRLGDGGHRGWCAARGEALAWPLVRRGRGLPYAAGRSRPLGTARLFAVALVGRRALPLLGVCLLPTLVFREQPGVPASSSRLDLKAGP